MRKRSKPVDSDATAKAATKSDIGSFFGVLKSPSHRLDSAEVVKYFNMVDETRVRRLASLLSGYLSQNLPKAIDKRSELADYRTNPYVLMTSAHVMAQDEPKRFADFLFNTKLYMGLETSFGKSIESSFVSQYPLHKKTVQKWVDAPEKIAEFATYQGMTREERAAKRTDSVWREIDKSAVVGERRYLISIKSGPNCINDTQVAGMTDAITKHYQTWLSATNATYPHVRKLDVVIGLTYGTDKTTNNKENQILAKLLVKGFREEGRLKKPGVLIDPTGTVRVYRRIGKDFWATIGNPVTPEEAQFVFLEILLSLAAALTAVKAKAALEARINDRIIALIAALKKLLFPRSSLPQWVRSEFSDSELFWSATALTAFYDEGI